MELSIKKSKISGTIEVPGSKSHTIRAICLASLASGTSTIRMPLLAEDSISCLRAASILGSWIKRGDDTVWRISGTGGHFLKPAKTLQMGNSGTGLRLFTAMTALRDYTLQFDGDDSLRTRDMAPLFSALEQLGAKIQSENGKCPFSLTGPIHSGEVTIDGTSSQYLSALLLVAPLISGETVIHVKNLNEKPYVEMTLGWLKRQNIQLEHNDDLSYFKIKGDQKYTPFTTQIPVDFSSAAFPLLAAAVTGEEVKIPNLDFSDSQGDKAVFDYFSQMGVKITTEKYMTIIQGPQKLRAFDLDINATPDALPALAVAAACSDGVCTLRNVAQARYKECDRISVMTQELTKMGIKVEEIPDGMIITGGKLKGCTSLDSHKDHRIAMALAIACMVANGSSVVHDVDCINVTFPSFIEEFSAAGANFLTISQ